MLLEDSESEGGGIRKRGNIQRGGYNVYRYNLNRLIEADKELFSGYSVSQRKSSKNKKGTQGYTYATKCTPNNQRQPIVITKEQLDNYRDENIAEGVGFREAFNIESRNPDNYYICPKYWDVKNEKPLDPNDYESFKDDIVDNKSSTAQKKNSDKYILAKDHNYWNKMGNDINNYRLELWENFHPEGYKVPCCYARKDEIKVGWDVDVRVKDKSKERWISGKVKSIKNITKEKKEYTITLTGERVEDVVISNNLDIRRKRGSKYVSNNFPSNIGVYGYVHPIIKNYLYPTDIPKIDQLPDIQLYRKGIKRGTTKSDKTFLESIQELLHEYNTSIKDLIGNIVYDLNSLKNTHNYISAIGGGSFINLFKKEINEIDDSDAILFRKYLKKRKSRFTDTPLERQIQNIKNKDSLLKMMSLYSDDPKGVFINREFTEITAINQFIKYLQSDNEIILDTYVIPVLTAISRYPSKTFGSKPIDNLSIVVFEGNSEEVIITPPMGRYNRDTTSLMFLYKERGHLYEPIMYVKGGFSQSILVLDSIIKQDKLEEYERNWKNHVINQTKTKINESYKTIPDKFMSIEELKIVLQRLKLPVINYIYDNYNKIILIETKNNIYIPVKPSDICNNIPIKFIGETKRSTYSKCIKILSSIDKLSNHESYLENSGITVLGITNRKKQVQLRVKELVFSNGIYINLKQEPYSDKHTLPVIGNISLSNIDKSIGLYGSLKDKRYLYNQENDIKNRLRSLFFQKSYILVKNNKEFMDYILSIKNHDIMLIKHKREKIYNKLHIKLKSLIKYNKKKDIDDKLNLDKGEYIEINNHISQLYNIDIEVTKEKLIRLFIDLLLNYSPKDYDRFLQIDLDITKIKTSINKDEYFIQQSDILNNSYLEYFIRYSQFIRNVGIYNEGLSRSKLIQLNNMKDNKEYSLEKIKEYPEILYTLFGRGILLKNSELCDIDVISNILEYFSTPEKEINPYIVQRLLDVSDKESHRIDKDDLLVLSKEYKKGFCLVTKEFTKKIYHEIDIVIDEHSFTGELKESEIILLYQDDRYIYHIIKKDKMSIPIKEITSKSFNKKLSEYIE